MELGELFIILFLGILTFLSECPTGSVAARICPVRAEPVYPAEVNGVVRCACVHAFFGKNCRFKEQNGTIVLNATRLTKDSIVIKWNEKIEQIQGRRYLISVRKIEYKLSTIVYYKWRKASIQYTNTTRGQSEFWQEIKSSDDLIQKEMSYTLPSSQTGYTAMLRLPATSSYEVKITTTSTAGNHTVGSTSVFFDASDAFVSGEMDKLDQFKNYLVDSFQDDCALKGIVVGVVLGSLGTLILMAFVYVLSRYCCKCKKFGRKSEVQDQITEATSEDVNLETSSIGISGSYVIIDFQDIDPVPIETVATTEREESKESIILEVNNAAFSPGEPSVSTEGIFEPKVKSVILNIPETVIDGEEPVQEPTEIEIATEPETNTIEVKPRTIWDAHEYDY